MCISGLVVEYIVAIDVTRVRFPADAVGLLHGIHVNTYIAPANTRLECESLDLAQAALICSGAQNRSLIEACRAMGGAAGRNASSQM